LIPGGSTIFHPPRARRRGTSRHPPQQGPGPSPINRQISWAVFADGFPGPTQDLSCEIGSGILGPFFRGARLDILEYQRPLHHLRTKIPLSPDFLGWITPSGSPPAGGSCPPKKNTTLRTIWNIAQALDTSGKRAYVKPGRTTGTSPAMSEGEGRRTGRGFFSGVVFTDGILLKA